MNEDILISIIIPTFNSQRYLSTCIDSILEQNYNNYEIIIIDNVSSDNTIDILESKKSSKIKIFSQMDKGISDAFNKGIDKSRGEYLLFLGSDDSLFEKNTLKRINKDITGTKFKELYLYNVFFIDEKNNKIKLKRNNFENFKYLNIYKFISHQGIIFKRSLFEKYSCYDTNFKYAMDYEFILRISKHIKPIYINRTISNFRKDGSNVSSKFWLNQLIEKDKINEKYFDKKGVILSKIFLILISVKKIFSKYK